MKFSEKIALITGAAVGIGRSVALELARGGASLVLADMNLEKLQLVKQETEALGAKTVICRCDVSDPEQVKATVKTAEDAFGRVDILVNNAALWRQYTPFTETPMEIWEQYYRINVMGTVYFSRCVIEGMLRRQYGRIVNVASVAGVYGNANMTAYSATKGAVIAFTQALAKEVTAKGIVVNAVSPGTVSPSEDDNENAFVENALCYAGRTGTDAENAKLICFLASDDAPYVSGQNIQIDGCRHLI